MTSCRKILLVLATLALRPTTGSAQGPEWEYGTLVANSAVVLVWTAPDSQHVFCPSTGVKSPDTAVAKNPAVAETLCEFQERLLQIAKKDVLLNRSPDPESYSRIKADTVHWLPVRDMLNLLDRDGWELVGAPERTSFGNYRYTLKRLRRRR